MWLTFFAEDEKNPPSYLLFLATNRADLPTRFPILTQFEEDLHADIPILAKDDKARYVLYPNPGEDPIAVVIFVPSPAGFAQIWPYSSNPRRVLREYGYIRPILDGFCVNMAIFILSSAGFGCVHTNFKGSSPGMDRP